MISVSDPKQPLFHFCRYDVMQERPFIHVMLHHRNLQYKTKKHFCIFPHHAQLGLMGYKTNVITVLSFLFYYNCPTARNDRIIQRWLTVNRETFGFVCFVFLLLFFLCERRTGRWRVWPIQSSEAGRTSRRSCSHSWAQRQQVFCGICP